VKSSSYKSCLQRTSSLCFLHDRELPGDVLKHKRVSEVFKASEVHDFEYYGQRNYVLKWEFNLCHQKFSFTFDFKKLLESVLRFVTDVVLNILPCSANFTRVDRSTILEV